MRHRYGARWLTGREPRALHTFLWLSTCLVLSIVLWQLYAFWAGVSSREITPFGIVAAFRDLFASGELPKHAWESIKLVLAGITIGTCFAYPTALWASLSAKRSARVVPVLAFLLATSKIAVLYILMNFLGIYEASKIAIIAWSTYLFQFYFTFYEALSYCVPERGSPNAEILDAALVDGAGRWHVFRSILAPLCLPKFFMGLRFAFATSWTLLVVIEETGTVHGLGYIVSYAHIILEPNRVFAGTVILATVNLCSWVVVRQAERIVLAWRGISSEKDELPLS